MGNISGWDVTTVTDMGGLFKGRASFNADLSRWYAPPAVQLDPNWGSIQSRPLTCTCAPWGLIDV